VLLATEKPAVVTIPEKLSETLNRFVSVTVFAELVLPTLTVPKSSDVGDTVTDPPPVPVRLTNCGLFAALSVNVSVPFTAPITVGENVTPTVQLAPAAILVPQVLLATVKPALATMPESARAVFPWFDSVTVFAALVVPTTTVPRLKLVDDRVTWALPLPVSPTICVPALSVTVSVPVADPIAMGVKVTDMAQDAAGAMGPLQLFV
jgi:hypothetical protein